MKDRMAQWNQAASTSGGGPSGQWSGRENDAAQVGLAYYCRLKGVLTRRLAYRKAALRTPLAGLRYFFLLLTVEAV